MRPFSAGRDATAAARAGDHLSGPPGRAGGPTWLNAINDQGIAINDQGIGIGRMAVPGTPCDSLFILDALLNLDGGVKPEMVAPRRRLLLRRGVRNLQDARRRGGGRVRAAGSARPSPWSPTRSGRMTCCGCTAALNVLGRYSFTASQPGDGLRPLCDPKAVDLDDDDGNDE